MHSGTDSLKPVSSAHSLSSVDLAGFDEMGCAGPFRLCEPQEARRKLTSIRRVPRGLFPWVKGGHTMSRAIYDMGTTPEIVTKVCSVLGEDVLLWGSILIGQPPTLMHPWHVDMEHAHWDGVTVWLALQNVTQQSSFSVITRTHKFEHPWEQLHGSETLDLRDDVAVLASAREVDPRCEVIHFNMGDGEYVMMHGKTWHATRNRTENVRYSMILQYTRPDCQVRIPGSYGNRQTVWTSARPKCVLVSGRDNHGVNRLVDHWQIGSVANWVKGWSLYLPRNCMRVLKQRAAKRFGAGRS
jgi:hypothetical protein